MELGRIYHEAKLYAVSHNVDTVILQDMHGRLNFTTYDDDNYEDDGYYEEPEGCVVGHYHCNTDTWEFFNFEE